MPTASDMKFSDIQRSYTFHYTALLSVKSPVVRRSVCLLLSFYCLYHVVERSLHIRRSTSAQRNANFATAFLTHAPFVALCGHRHTVEQVLVIAEHALENTAQIARYPERPLHKEASDIRT